MIGSIYSAKICLIIYSGIDQMTSHIKFKSKDGSTKYIR